MKRRNRQAGSVEMNLLTNYWTASMHNQTEVGGFRMCSEYGFAIAQAIHDLGSNRELRIRGMHRYASDSEVI